MGVFGNNYILENKYEPPYSYEQILSNYGKRVADKLMKDPVHKWRATTKIELIHKEPSLKELKRIWKNWNLMNDNQKNISDKKSIELFGIDNKTHYYQLLKEY